MDASLLNFLLAHEMRIALQTAGEIFPKENVLDRCKCLRFGRYERMTDNEVQDAIALDTAWRKF